MAARRYEMMVILDSSQNDEEIDKQITKLEEMITSSEGGEIINTDRWGKKRLAYEIKGRQFGYYLVIEFYADSALPTVLDRHNRLDNSTVRHMILEIPPKVTKLKEREKSLKSSLEARRKEMAEQADDAPVVDLISDDERQAKASGEAEATEEAPAEAKDDAKDETEAEAKDDAKDEAKADEKEKAPAEVEADEKDEAKADEKD